MKYGVYDLPSSAIVAVFPRSSVQMTGISQLIFSRVLTIALLSRYFPTTGLPIPVSDMLLSSVMPLRDPTPSAAFTLTIQS